jgi:hypothetical protein
MLNYRLNVHVTTYDNQAEENYVLDYNNFDSIHQLMYKPFVISNVEFINVNPTNLYAHIGKYRNNYKNNRITSLHAFEFNFITINKDTNKIVITNSYQLKHFPHLFTDCIIQRLSGFSTQMYHKNAFLNEAKKSSNTFLNTLGQIMSDSMVLKIGYMYRCKYQVLKQFASLASSSTDYDYLYNCFPNFDKDEHEQIQSIIDHEFHKRNLDLTTVTQHPYCDLFNVDGSYLLKWYTIRILKQKLTKLQDQTLNGIDKFWNVHELDRLLDYIDQFQLYFEDAQMFEQIYDIELLYEEIMSQTHSKV